MAPLSQSVRDREKFEKNKAIIDDDSQIIQVLWLSKKLVWLWLGLIPILYLLLLNGNLSPFVDNARYITAARSLLSGNGYSHIHSQNITPQTLYPPGYPLLLAGFIYLFSLNILVLKLVSIFATIVALIGIYSLLTRYATFAGAAAVTLLVGINPLIAFFAAVELTEAPYLMLSVLAILFIARSTDEDRSSLYFPAAIAISTGAFYIRSAGIALLPAALFYFAYKKEYKKLLIFAFIFIALISPWFIRGLTIDSHNNGTYFKQLTWKDPHNISLGKANLFDFIRRGSSNFLSYATFGTFPFKENFGFGRWPAVPATGMALLLSTLVVIGCFRRIKDSFSVIEAYVLSYFTMQLLWPMTDIRFIHPILPFILFYFLIGASNAGGKLGNLLSKPLLAKKVVSALVVILIIISLSINLSLILANASKGGLEPEQAHFYGAIDWLKNNTAKSSYILSVRPETVFVLSDRRAEAYPRRHLLRANRYYDFILSSNFDYIVMDAFDYTKEARRPLARVINLHPREFKLVYAARSTSIKIFEVNKD